MYRIVYKGEDMHIVLTVSERTSGGYIRDFVKRFSDSYNTLTFVRLGSSFAHSAAHIASLIGA